MRRNSGFDIFRVVVLGLGSGSGLGLGLGLVTSDFDVRVVVGGRKQEVLGLEVTVHHTTLVKKLNASEQRRSRGKGRRGEGAKGEGEGGFELSETLLAAKLELKHTN